MAAFDCDEVYAHLDDVTLLTLLHKWPVLWRFSRKRFRDLFSSINGGRTRVYIWVTVHETRERPWKVWRGG